jgi:histidinol-phosphate aminotransferase
MINPRKAIRQLGPYRAPLEGRAGQLRLDFNENTVGAPRALVKALRWALAPESLALYPEYERPGEALADYFGVRPGELLLTNGVDDALKLICDTFVEPGDELIVPAPTFSMYQFYQQIAGGRTRPVQYSSGMRLDANSIASALTRRTRWIALANPNNPTGTLIAQDDLLQILRAAANALVLVDEAYFDFSGQTILPWIRRYPNLIVGRTFSKAFGLAGLRLGFLFTNSRLAAWMRRAHSPYAVNTAAVAAALAAIRLDGGAARYAAQICDSRDRFSRRLDALGIGHVPSAANFVLVRAGKQAGKIASLLRQQRILVRDWGRHPLLRHYLRISIGTPAQMARLLKALQPLLKRFEPASGAPAWQDLVTPLKGKKA